MKTKEIDVWIPRCRVYEQDIETYSTKDEAIRQWDDEIYKAKLIIELPEKKIEITESEFDAAYSRALSSYTRFPKEAIKKQLGFTND